jgi:hypothetical protein
MTDLDHNVGVQLVEILDQVSQSSLLVPWTGRRAFERAKSDRYRLAGGICGEWRSSRFSPNTCSQKKDNG